MAYAEKTSVSFERSIAEIMELIQKAGADQVGQMQSPNGFAVQFTLADRMVRFRVPFETIDEMPTRDGRNALLSKAQRQSRLEQSRRQRGRALLLTVKAKLESVESGIETFEQAFLAHVVMSDGKTVYERIGESMAIEYQTGRPSMALLSDDTGRDK